MTASVVQGPVKTAAGGDPPSIDRAFVSDVTAGNYMIVVSTIQNPYSGTADAVGHTITESRDAGAFSQVTPDSAVLSSAEFNRVWYKKIVSSGPCTVTLTPTVGVSKLRLIVMEVSGLDGTTALEDENAGNGTSTTPSAGDVITAGGGFVLAVALNTNNYNTITAGGSGYSTYSAADLYGYCLLKYKVVTAGTYTGDFSMSNGAWSAIAVAFKEPAGGGGTITADQGSFSLNGQTTSLLFNRTLAADNGSYALTGQDVTLQRDTPGQFTLQADAGSYSWNGSEALADYAMNADAGSFALSGQEVTFSIGVPASYTLNADPGYYAYTGRNARLDWSGAPIVPNRQAGIYMGMRIGL